MKRAMRVLAGGGVVVLSLGLAAGAAPTTGVNFTGVTLTNVMSLNGFYASPPDTMGATGPNHIVELVNGAYAVYTKTGALVGSMATDATFWSNAGISSTVLDAGICDPRVIFDPASNRWFASEINVQATGNQVLLARSNSADPTAGWKAVNFTGNTGFADYDTLSLDANGVYIGTNNFNSGGSFTGVSLFSVPKADLTAATPTLANMTAFNDLSASTYGFTLQGALNFGSSVGHGVMVAVNDNFPNSRLNRFNINGPGGAGATLSSETDVLVATTSSPTDADQPSALNSIDALDVRISANVVQVGSNLFMVRTITSGTHDALRWTILNEATNAVVAEGTLTAPSADLYQGSLAVNPFGDVVLGYNQSSASEYASSYAVVGKFDGSALVFGAPMLLKAGNGTIDLSFAGPPQRWGDYAAVRLDPSDPNSFWVFNEYVDAAVSTPYGTGWSTQITQIIIPEPTTLGLLALGLAGFFARRRR